MTGEDYDALQAWAATYNDCALFADGYEDAVLGIAERCGQPAVVAYDAGRCIEILMSRDGMDNIEAEEYFQHNTLGAWAGEHTPVFLWHYRPEPPPAAEQPGLAAK